MNNIPVQYIDAICPECGGRFKYVKNGYRPTTCPNRECVKQYLHPELRRRDYEHTEATTNS